MLTNILLLSNVNVKVIVCFKRYNMGKLTYYVDKENTFDFVKFDENALVIPRVNQLKIVFLQKCSKIL